MDCDTPRSVLVHAGPAPDWPGPAPARTRARLPLPALSSCGVDLSLDDFQRVSDRVPFICDLKPSGRYVMEDIHKVRRGQGREGQAGRSSGRVQPRRDGSAAPGTALHAPAHSSSSNCVVLPRDARCAFASMRRPGPTIPAPPGPSPQVGGTPALLKYLDSQGFINRDCLTVTGEQGQGHVLGPRAAGRRDSTNSTHTTPRCLAVSGPPCHGEVVEEG